MSAALCKLSTNPKRRSSNMRLTASPFFAARRRNCSKVSTATLQTLHQRYRAAPAGARSLDLHRQTGNEKAMRPGNQLQVRELLDLAVLAGDAREMSRPNEAAIAGLLEIGDHAGEGPVERPGVDPDDTHTLFNQPKCTLPAQPGLQKIVSRAPAL